MSPLVAELFQRMHSLGLARDQVADKAGVSKAAVAEWENKGREPNLSLVQLVGQVVGLELRWVEVGKPLVKPFRKFTPDTMHLIIQMYKAGAKLTSISLDTGLSRQTISRVIANYAYDIRRRRRITPEQISQVYSLHLQGMSNGAIARKLGIGPDSVRRRLLTAVCTHERTEGCQDSDCGRGLGGAGGANQAPLHREERAGTDKDAA